MVGQWEYLLRRLTTLYNAYTKGLEPLLQELPIQYADFAIWQREYLQEKCEKTS
ncbi:MAG UNVERIFIED_CONTAM: hypothetical protein LVR29_16610 [Microcystis novacekii LVE1205-3]|jgi:hypothetical protein